MKNETITISHSVSTAVRPSARVLETAAMFGLGTDETRELAIVPRCEIPLPHLNGRSGIVFITGPSGSGKSTILRLIGEQVENAAAAGASVTQDFSDNPLLLRFDRLTALQDVPLVDALGGPGMSLERTMAALSVAGLGEAFVMLRRPCELSDGQRYRLRLAQIIAMLMNDDSVGDAGANADCQAHRRANCHTHAHARAAIVLADEFGSTLDRITAQTVARNVRRWIDRQTVQPISFIVATAHDDLLEALRPDVLVWKGLGDQIEVVTR